MGECFGLFFLIATSLTGIFSLIGRLLVLWLKSGESLGDEAVVILRGHVEEAEFLLRRYIWLGFETVRVLDAGMDEETAAVVARFARRRSIIVEKERIIGKEVEDGERTFLHKDHRQRGRRHLQE